MLRSASSAFFNSCSMFMETRGMIRPLCSRLIHGKRSPTDIKVPGRKNKVTSVMTFMETVSIFVLRAMSFISSVIVTILFVEYMFV